jgi:hypothetical protein
MRAEMYSCPFIGHENKPSMTEGNFKNFKTRY